MSFHPNSAPPTGALRPAGGWLLPFRRLWLIGLLASILVAGGATWLNAQRGGPTILWSQPEALEFLLPSEQRTLRLSFRSAQDLSNVEVFVTPSLSSVISVTPKSFRRIKANSDTKLTFTLIAPATSEVKFDGTVHLRSHAGSKATYAEPLPLTIVVHIEPLPPDPGEAGKQTLEGIDSDADGVRDDVERYLVSNYYNNVPSLSALIQLAKANQAFMRESHNNQKTILDVVRMRQQAQDCLQYTSGTPTLALRAQQELRAVLVNTKARFLAYAQADSKLSGQFFPARDPSKYGSSCSG